MELRGLPLQGFPVALLKDLFTRIKADLLEVSIKDSREKWVSEPVSSSPTILSMEALEINRPGENASSDNGPALLLGAISLTFKCCLYNEENDYFMEVW